MRLVTLAGPAGATVAAVREGDAFHALLDAGGVPYADLGAALAGGFDGASPEALGDGYHVVRPVLSPAAIVCVGINYGAHIQEMGRETPTSPTLFLKLPQALLDPGDDVAMPPESGKVDYEGELVAVVGRGGRRIPRDEALDHVAGVTLMNDVTMRDFQYRSIQWFAGKSWRASTPVGPEVVTLDELDGLEARELTTTVNGELRQKAAIGDLVFDIPSLVADISQVIELAPGDLIATGTPGGVGHGMDPPGYLSAGDVVEVSVDGVGTLRTTFVSG
ncbi:MAG TPA: fumarylacetoacetate hydrolase family protein [Gaiellaceae bacterium]|jgi:acylpyruvate hydrolase|nr:fumarylacetoacetate hydrolase family protein [Gaiellaceae bacterium]